MTRDSDRDFVGLLDARMRAGEELVVATVVRVVGSASAKPGARAVFDARGQLIYGWVGGGCAESAVRDAAREVLAARRPRILLVDLDDEVLGVGMPCGGHMEVFIAAMTQAARLLILGHGRIAETLCELGALLGFHVTVNDPLATPEAFPRADLRVTEDPDYAKAECDARTYVVITTQHKSDFEALLRVLSQSPAYVALVASRKRSGLVLERLHEEGVSVDALRRVAAPAGLDLGAETPQEIALSIMAEIVRLARGGTATGKPLVELRGVRVDDAGVEVPEGSVDSERCPR